MPKITFILRDGEAREIDASDGMSVMEVALNAGLRGINGDCGGECQCATCHVYIDDAHVSKLAPPAAVELDMLEGVAAPIEPSSRLSCQIILSPAIEGIVVRIPETQ